MCSRCREKELDCNYTAPKHMGRPKKQLSDADQGRTEAGARGASTISDTRSLGDAHVSSYSGPTGVSSQETHSSAWGPAANAQYVGSGSLTDTGNSGRSNDGSYVAENPSDFEIELTTRASTSTPPTSASVTLPIAEDTFEADCIEAMHASVTGCACLSAMYLELSSLQTMCFSFPNSIHQLRKAILIAYGVLNCPNCPKSFFTAIQNMQLLNLFILAIAERYTKILDAIDWEMRRAISAKTTISFKMGNLQGSNIDLHLPDNPLCIKDMEVNLDPKEWRILVKRVVQAEVKGSPIDYQPSFLALVQALKERQIVWHTQPPDIDYPRPLALEHGQQCDLSETLKVCRETERIVECMDFD